MILFILKTTYSKECATRQPAHADIGAIHINGWKLIQTIARLMKQDKKCI